MPLISSHKALQQFLDSNPRIANSLDVLYKDSIGFTGNIGDGNFQDRFDFPFHSDALEALVACYDPPSFESLKELAGPAKSLEELSEHVMLDLALNMLRNSQMHLSWFADRNKLRAETLKEDCGWMWDRAKAYFVTDKAWQWLIPAERQNLFNNLMAPHK